MHFCYSTQVLLKWDFKKTYLSGWFYIYSPVALAKSAGGRFVVWILLTPWSIEIAAAVENGLQRNGQDNICFAFFSKDQYCFSLICISFQMSTWLNQWCCLNVESLWMKHSTLDLAKIQTPTPHKSLYTDVILAVESVCSFLNSTMEVNQVIVSSTQNEI